MAASTYTYFVFDIYNVTDEEWAWLHNNSIIVPVEYGVDDASYITVDMPVFIAENCKEFVEITEHQMDESGIEAGFVLSQCSGNARFAADEGAWPAVAAFFVMLFLRKFRPRECKIISWAEITDRDIPDGFGGGAIFVHPLTMKVEGIVDGRSQLAMWAEEFQSSLPSEE